MKKIKVLLAEDHEVMRKGISELINQEEDMEVIGEVYDGQQAVELAKKLNPDVIIMDISMPNMNGIEATYKIKEVNPLIQILIFTIYDNEEFIMALLEAKASGYLLKNAKNKELINAIRAVYEGDSVINSDIMNKILNKINTKNKEKNIIKEKQILSKREIEVVELGAKGLINKEIADILSLSDRTIQSHWRNIFVKLNVSSRIEAIMFCIENEIININLEHKD